MIEKVRSAKVGRNALSSAIITGDKNTATITITNYCYRESTKELPIDSTDAADESLPCPYRGLFHFAPDDAEFFFGCDLFVAHIPHPQAPLIVTKVFLLSISSRKRVKKYFYSLYRRIFS